MSEITELLRARTHPEPRKLIKTKGQRFAETMSELANIAGTIRQIQQRRAEQSFLAQLAGATPDQYRELIMGAPEQEERGFGSRLLNVFNPGGQYPGVSSTQSELQKRMIVQEIKGGQYGAPPWYMDPKYGETIEGQIASGEIPRATIKKPEKIGLKVPDRETVMGVCELVMPKDKAGDPVMPENGRERGRLVEKAMKILNFRHWDKRTRQMMADIMSAHFDIAVVATLRQRKPRSKLPTGLNVLDDYVLTGTPTTEGKYITSAERISRPKKGLKKLDDATALAILKEAGYDNELAKKIARQRGYIVEE